MNSLESSELILRLQLLQRRLGEMANDLGNLTDPEIVAVSEEADRLIIQLQRLRKEEAEHRKLSTMSDSCSSLSAISASQSSEEASQQGSTFLSKHS